MTPDKKALNRWAHQAGHNDFDTYIQTGGSILDARQDIRIRISWLAKALNDLDSQMAPTNNPLINEQARNQPLNLPQDHDSEPPDPKNAHPQGAEQ